MASGGRARTAAWLAAAVMLVGAGAAGCGDGSGGGDEAAGPTGTAAAPSAGDKGDRPSDPETAEERVRRNWERFFDPAVPNDKKIDLLENGSVLRPLLTSVIDDGRGRQVSAGVSKVTFTSATHADVRYALILKGRVALPNAAGVSVLQDGVWKVSVGSLCALVKLSDTQTNPPGC